MNLKKIGLILAGVLCLGIVLVLAYIFLLIFSPPCCGPQDSPGSPGTYAGKLIQSISENNGLMQETPSTTFKEGANINSRGLSLGIKGYLEESEFCISLGDFNRLSDWAGGIENGNSASITYSSSTPLQAKIAAVCDTVTNVKSFDGHYFSSNLGSELQDEWFSSCSCLQDDQGRCCFVALKKAS